MVQKSVEQIVQELVHDFVICAEDAPAFREMLELVDKALTAPPESDEPEQKPTIQLRPVYRIKQKVFTRGLRRQARSEIHVRSPTEKRNSRNSGQVPLSAGDGLPALMMADQVS